MSRSRYHFFVGFMDTHLHSTLSLYTKSKVSIGHFSKHLIVHLPSTLRSTESFSSSNGPNTIRMPYSSSSPDVTFKRTNEATDFDKFPVHVMRPLYLDGAALVSVTPVGDT